MYTKLIKFVLLLSLVLLSGFAGRVLYSPLLNRASRGRDPRHIFGVLTKMRKVLFLLENPHQVALAGPHKKVENLIHQLESTER